ncbi:MAG: Radical SAM domain protein [Parcubacteria group bacterium GW2011_GWA2_40_23]|nr:MAG: Radical SAM domain protein [Parcubacteria group bacterium GW2011_GWA2_40_23]
MFNRKHRAQARIIWRWVVNLWRALILGKDHVLPFVNVFHLTHRCDANCTWCSQREVIGEEEHPELPHEKLRIVLLRLFKISPALYITGGEPTMHNELVPLLKLARELGFWPITVNANGLQLYRFPEILQYADRTVVSLHSHDTHLQCKILGIRPRIVFRLITNLRAFRRLAEDHGNKLFINCVLSSENVHWATAVLKLCILNRTPLTINPVIIDRKPALETASVTMRQEYQAFLDLVIKQKKTHPWVITNTRRYLMQTRNFGSFHCRPLCIMCVNPDGTVQNPCRAKYPYVDEVLGSLLKEEALVLLNRGLNFKDSFTGCKHNCCKTCFVEPALSLAHPFSAIMSFVH